MQFNRRYVCAALICLFAAAPSLVAAAVALVPEWVSPQHNGMVVYDGVHLYSVPSMQALGVHRELPATHNAAVSADGSRLYLWDDALEVEKALYVYDLPAFTLRHVWPAFAGDRQLAQYSTVHPRAPVLIFGGVDWFDTETGEWTQSPETLNIDRRDSLPRVSEDGRWLSFVASRHVGGVSFPPLKVFVLDIDDPAQQTSFDFPGDPYLSEATTLVDQAGTRILVGYPDVHAFRLPSGTPLPDIALPPDLIAVESIVGANGSALVSAIGPGPAAQQPYEQRIYRISATGEASLMEQFASVGEIGTLQSLGSDLLRLGFTYDSCLIGCRQVPTSATGFSVNGAPITTLSFDVGTYARGPLLVADSVFGGGGVGVAQAVPAGDPIGLFALVLMLTLSALLVGRLALRSVA